MSFRAALIVLVCAGAAAVVVLWSSDERASSASRMTQEPVADLAPQASVPAPLRAPVVDEEEVPAADHEPATAREALAAWHGERWPAVERELVARGVQLDQAYSQRPWEEVAPAFESRIGISRAKRAALVRVHQHWPEVVSPDWVRREFSGSAAGRPVDEADAAAIATLVAPANAVIAVRAEQWSDLLDSHVHECWRTGRYVRSPFTTEGVADEGGFHSESHAGDGWAVTISLARSDCPDLVEVEQEMELLCRERDALVAEYLRER